MTSDNKKKKDPLKSSLSAPILSQSILDSNRVIKVKDPKKREREINKTNSDRRRFSNNLFKGIGSKLETKLKPRENKLEKHLSEVRKDNERKMKDSKRKAQGFRVREINQNKIDNNYNKARKVQENLLMFNNENDKLYQINLLRNFEAMGYLPANFCERLGYKTQEESMVFNLYKGFSDTVKKEDTEHEKKGFEHAKGNLEKAVKNSMTASTISSQGESDSNVNRYIGKAMNNLKDVFNCHCTKSNKLKRLFKSEYSTLEKEYSSKEYKSNIGKFAKRLNKFSKSMLTESKKI